MSAFHGSPSPGPSQPKKRRIDLELDASADASSGRGQDYSRNIAQDHARAHYGNVYGNVYYDNTPPQPTSGDAAETSDMDGFMETLRFQSMGERHATIHKAYTSTCKWLLDHPKHVDWRDQVRSIEHNRLLWIKGKPGAGKSTMMKFAFDHAASEWKGHTVISFFFNARGAHLEKTTEGMYRSLLVQILEKFPSLRSALSERHAGRQRKSWSVQELKDMFEFAVMHLGQEARLVCYIDALDECSEDEARDMVDFFEDLGESAIEDKISLYTCFASRPYPNITVAKGLQLTLQDQSGHQNDIKQYIAKKMKGSGRAIANIKTELERRASGVFLWVVLVIPILRKASDGGRVHSLQRHLADIPTDLSDLFARILTFNAGSRSELVITLQWISFAERPLRAAELYFAVHSDTNPGAEGSWDSTKLNDIALSQFVVDSSRGLAELTKGKRPVVQFIHESVRTYLQETGLKLLDPDLGRYVAGFSHDRLRQCCYRYVSQQVMSKVASRINATASSSPTLLEQAHERLPTARSSEGERLRKRIADDLPFLEYAIRGVLYHADASDGHDISQHSFMRKVPWPLWVFLANATQTTETRRYKSLTVDCIYIFANEGMLHLLQDQLRHRKHCDVRTKGERYKTPLDAAIAHGNLEATRLLLKQGIDKSYMHRNRLLSKAVKMESTEVLKMLLDARIHYDADGLTGGQLDSLYKQATNHQICRPVHWDPLVKLLHARDLGHNKAPSSVKNIPLIKMAMHDNRLDVARLLLDAGWKTEMVDVIALLDPPPDLIKKQSDFRRLLIPYASDPSLKTILLMLQSTMDNSDDHESIYDDPWLDVVRQSPMGIEVVITTAVLLEDCKMVQHLLFKGTDPNLAILEAPLLHIACFAGRPSIVRLLLDHGASIDIALHAHLTRLPRSDHVIKVGYTALSTACAYGHARVVELLISHITNLQSYDFRHALLEACLNKEDGQSEILNMLIAAGANIGDLAYGDQVKLREYADFDRYALVDMAKVKKNAREAILETIILGTQQAE